MKYALITGAYGGMGSKTVEEFTSQGYTVFALDRKTKETSGNVIPIEVDLTYAESVKNAFEIVKNYTDRLDVIIHFAGMYNLDSLIEIKDDDFDKIFKVNVYSVFYVNKTFMPLLKSGSKIIMTTSELAPLNPLPFTGIYAITKSTLDKYAYSLKMELQLLGVHVSVLRAGAVDTGMIGASTTALDKFCSNTAIYQCNAERFKKIVDGVEAKKIAPIKIAKKAYKIASKKKPKFIYAINRNKLLLLLNVLPKRMQFWVIKAILKK